MTSHSRTQPIGVFDSGVGGLTVLKAMRSALPQEHFIYLGDTARLPYGTKSPASIERYACQAAAHLKHADVKLLVVACNTASAVALSALQVMMGATPVIGVVQPGADAAVTTGIGRHHLVLATEATVRLGAYKKAILERDSSAIVTEIPCELLVALAEEGWTEGDIPEAIVRRYLATVTGPAPDTIILGCTHFPLLATVIDKVSPASAVSINSANTTAAQVATTLNELALRNPSHESGTMAFLATDGARRFARVGGQFLGTPLVAENIELVDL